MIASCAALPASGQEVNWSFAPVASVLPDSLSNGTVVAVGGQKTCVAREAGDTSVWHLVHNGQATRLFAAGESAPGGGTFNNDGPNFLPVSAEQVVFRAFVVVDPGGALETRYFRWESGTLLHLPNPPAGVTYDFTRNDGNGRFLAHRQDGSLFEYWITDGLLSGPSFTTDEPMANVVGITADGSMLVHEESFAQSGCNIAFGTKLYFVGNRSEVLGDHTQVFNNCGQPASGTSILGLGVNGAGDAVSLIRNHADPSTPFNIVLHKRDGSVVTITDSASFSKVSQPRITFHPQVIFYGETNPDLPGFSTGTYLGPTASDRFSGDFMMGFGQDGQVDSVGPFHEHGIMLVIATLADSNQVQAIGLTSDGVSPAITNGPPPNGTNRLAYAFQFAASGSPSPTFTLADGSLPPGLSLSPDGELSGTPTNAGEFAFTVRAANGVDPDATNAYTLVIAPRNPVVFLHGVAGSVLKTGSRYIWPTVAPGDVADLHLVNGPADTEAVDVVREYDVGGLGAEVLQFYGPFIRHMVEEQDYVEFDLEEDRSRLINFYLINTPFQEKPDLFTFPYDWRRPNASHVATLHTFIQRICELHDGAKVNLVAHSMGGLVMRRYLIEYGSESVERVVTVGSPIWGAPESAFRMFTGIFFGVGPIDFINSRAMKESVLSMPAVHELNPSSKYLHYWGFPVFQEVGTDYNENGLAGEGYSSSQFRVALDEEASPHTPATNNIAFHGYLAGRQDDWSQDDGSVGFLHIIGKQAVDNTTVGIEVRSRTFLTPLNLLASPRLLQVFSSVAGEGDGTVPTLGSARLPEYYAPGTMVREITEPLANVPSIGQPAGQAAEHTMLMSNTNVWRLINEFLDTGTLDGPMSLSSRAKSGEPAPLNVNTNVRRQILVAGCPWVVIRDASTSNTVYGGIASRPIPGVDVLYNSEEDWVLIEFDANRDLWVERGPGCAAVEIEVIDQDASGGAQALQRYRFDSGTNGWQLSLGGDGVTSLRVDGDADGAYEEDEEIAPSHTAQGPGTDVTPPAVDLQLSRVGDQIRLALAASDTSEPVTIWVSIDGGPRQLYQTNLFVDADAEATVAVYAEDALGNTSGLIQTRINPALSLTGADSDRVVMAWPTADGYRLESASTPEGPWTPVPGIRTKGGDGMTTMTATVIESPTVVYRLARSL